MSARVDPKVRNPLVAPRHFAQPEDSRIRTHMHASERNGTRSDASERILVHPDARERREQQILYKFFGVTGIDL